MFKKFSDSQGYIIVVLIWVSLANDVEKFSNVYLQSSISLEVNITLGVSSKSIGDISRQQLHVGINI